MMSQTDYLMNAAACRKDNIDEREKEEPNYINKMPIPSRRFEPEMFLRFKTALHKASPTDKKENRSD